MSKANMDIALVKEFLSTKEKEIVNSEVQKSLIKFCVHS